MAISWYAGYGGYDNTGPYSNVLLVGSPDNNLPSLSNVKLDEARAQGYAKGIGFEVLDNEHLKVYVNLAGVSVTDTGRLEYNGHYIQYSGTYDFYVKFSFSRNNGASFEQAYISKDVSHASNQNLMYASGWQASTFVRDYIITFDPQVTHLKFEIYGADATFPYSNIYTRKQIVNTYKPYAIRKGGVFKTLSRPSGFLKIRKSNNWVEKSEELYGTERQENKGHNRIRKSNKWLEQAKIGND